MLLVCTPLLLDWRLRRLIINADDFGLTSGVNRAILEAHQRGMVTSATLMANSAAFDEAVRLAKSAPDLSLGCHVVLIDGSPVLGAAQVATLVTGDSGANSRFRSGSVSFALRALSGFLSPREIEAEATAQIRKIQAASITVSHIDTHKHTHILPQVLVPLLRAAKACGVRAVRNPFEPTSIATLRNRPGLWKRRIALRTLRALAQQKFQRAVKDAGMSTPDGSVGLVATGTLDEQVFRDIIEHLPEGTWEFVCHPGYDDEQLRQVQTRLRESRARELELLISPAARSLLARNYVEGICYRDLY